MICGLTTEEIARAFLQPEATIAQRIVRAKRTLSESGLAYETPRGEALSERLASVLEVVYLIFNEGYTAARGDEWLRPQLCNDALRMGRVLTSSRAAGGRSPRPAGADGAERLAHRGAHRRRRRSDSADGPEPGAVGPASDPPRSVGACAGATNSAAGADSTRCRRRSSPATPEPERPMRPNGRASRHSTPNWPRWSRSPIIELNRAVAVGMAEGPAAALAIVDELAHEPALKNYHLLGSVRGDLLCKLGRFAEARAAFEAAAELAGNKREQQLLKTSRCRGVRDSSRADVTCGTDHFRDRWAPRPEPLRVPAALQS